MRKVLFILGQLSDLHVEWLSDNGQHINVQAGTILITEGEFSDSVYIVLDGSLTVRSSIYKQENDIILRPGEIFGEMSFVDSFPPIATVTAVEKCNLLKIPCDVLNKKIGTDHEFGEMFYKAVAMFLSDRLRNMMGRPEPGNDGNLPQGILEQDELDENVLRNITQAGARFDRLLKKLKDGQ